jgi:hypothetical protein
VAIHLLLLKQRAVDASKLTSLISTTLKKLPNGYMPAAEGAPAAKQGKANGRGKGAGAGIGSSTGSQASVATGNGRGKSGSKGGGGGTGLAQAGSGPTAVVPPAPAPQLGQVPQQLGFMIPQGMLATNGHQWPLQATAGNPGELSAGIHFPGWPPAGSHHQQPGFLPQMQALSQGPAQGMWGLPQQPSGQQLRPPIVHVPRLPWAMPQQGEQGTALPQLQGQEAPQTHQEQQQAGGNDEGSGVGLAGKGPSLPPHDWVSLAVPAACDSVYYEHNSYYEHMLATSVHFDSPTTVCSRFRMPRFTRACCGFVVLLYHRLPPSGR